MLKENQTERSVLFYEDESGIKVQFEYGQGVTLTQVADMFKNFLNVTGFNYVTDVVVSSGTGQWTSEPAYHPGHEEQMASDNIQEEDEIPF